MIKCACQRILGAGAGEVDDALQNTFLVLAARRAREVDMAAPSAPELHGVAIRCARQAASANAHAAPCARSAVALSSPSEQPGQRRRSWPHRSISPSARLSPDPASKAVILCHLEDLSSLRDATVQAGCPVATMGWRSAEGLQAPALRIPAPPRRLHDLGVVTGLLATQASLAHTPSPFLGRAGSCACGRDPSRHGWPRHRRRHPGRYRRGLRRRAGAGRWRQSRCDGSSRRRTDALCRRAHRPGPAGAADRGPAVDPGRADHRAGLRA